MDGLVFWHPANDTALYPNEYFALGDAPKGSSDDLPFRIANLSLAYGAQNVVISAAVSGSQGTPAAHTQLYLSTDGFVWTATATIPAIGPATASPMVWLRRVTPTTATTGGPYGFTLRAAATSWI